MRPLLPRGSVPTRGIPYAPTPPDLRPSMLNEDIVRRHRTYGRPLRGDEASEPTAPIRGPGAISKTPYYHDSWAGGDLSVEQANADDDSIGNGIFDGPGSAPIQNAGSGVFESKYAEPGWLYREQMNRPSEIVDANTGGQMMFRPGGGGWHEDMSETYDPFSNETPRYYAVGSTEPAKSAGVGNWAVAGIIAGVAIALFVGTLKVKDIP